MQTHSEAEKTRNVRILGDRQLLLLVGKRRHDRVDLGGLHVGQRATRPRGLIE